MKKADQRGETSPAADDRHIDHLCILVSDDDGVSTHAGRRHYGLDSVACGYLWGAPTVEER